MPYQIEKRKVALHPYQQQAAEWLTRRETAALWLDMGLGKTATVLTALGKLSSAGQVKRVLVIAPKRVAVSVWPSEFRKWQPELTGIFELSGSAKQRAAQLETNAAGLYVISRELVPWLVEHLGRDRWPFDTVVIDESSSFKNHSSKRFRALKKIRGKIKRLYEMTGTPAPNGSHDLWSQIWLLDQGESLGKTVTAFRQRWFDKDFMGWTYLERPNAQAEIRAAVDEMVLTLRAKDYLDLPPVLENFISVPLATAERKKYDELREHFALHFAESQSTFEASAVNAAVLLCKLQQLANGFVYGERIDDLGDFDAWKIDHVLENADNARATVPVHKRKLEAVDEILAGTGDNVLIFYQFQADLEMLRDAFPFLQTLDDGDDVIDRWNAGQIRLLAMHPASGGHGLNLQSGGHTVVWYSLPWSLELYQQGIARLQRMGQEGRVIVHTLVAHQTVDERVRDAIRDKDMSQERLLSAMNAQDTATVDLHGEER